MVCPVFVITAHATNSDLNKLLLHLRAWEYGEEPSWDDFYLFESKTIVPALGGPVGTVPPVQTSRPDFLSRNEWVGSPISEIEKFLTDKFKSIDDDTRRKLFINLELFVVLDARGIRDQTIIVCDRAAEPDDGTDKPIVMLDVFNKARVPWSHTSAMVSNLDIANMDWEDFVDDEAGPGPDDADEGGSNEATGTPGSNPVSERMWWRWEAFEETDPAVERQRDQAIEELRDRGLID